MKRAFIVVLIGVSLAACGLLDSGFPEPYRLHEENARELLRARHQRRAQRVTIGSEPFCVVTGGEDPTTISYAGEVGDLQRSGFIRMNAVEVTADVRDFIRRMGWKPGVRPPGVKIDPSIPPPPPPPGGRAPGPLALWERCRRTAGESWSYEAPPDKKGKRRFAVATYSLTELGAIVGLSVDRDIVLATQQFLTMERLVEHERDYSADYTWRWQPTPLATRLGLASDESIHRETVRFIRNWETSSWQVSEPIAD